MIFDFYIDKSEQGKPLRVCKFCYNEWKNNDRRRLIDHMIACPRAPTSLKERLLQRDKQDALAKQAQIETKQASQQIAVQNCEPDDRKRIKNWISETESEFARCYFNSSSDEEFEEGQPKDTITQDEKENIDRLLIKMIYHCELPVSVVEDPSFLTFMKSARPAYYKSGLPRKAEVARAIVRRTEQRVRKVKKQMGNVDYLGRSTRSQDSSFHQQRQESGDLSFRSQELSEGPSRDLGIGSSHNAINREDLFMPISD